MKETTEYTKVLPYSSHYETYGISMEALSSLAYLSAHSHTGKTKMTDVQPGGLLYEITGPYNPYACLKPISSCTPKTQKARGYKALSSAMTGAYLKRPANYSLYIGPEFSLHALNIKLSIKDWLKKHGALTSYSAGRNAKGFMARPCPSVPRHGFVESRQVFTSEDLKQVIEETRAADPRGEVLVVPLIQATYSSVITDNVVTVGPSNNGATAGIGSTSFPCVSNIRKYLDLSQGLFEVDSGYSILPSNYVGLRPKTREPFVEMVQERLVQVRYGPKVSAAHTWSPEPSVKVRVIWQPSQNTLNDFVQFESSLDEKYREWGSMCVLYLPHGTLTSHAAVQAICKGMPVITGENTLKPVVGMIYRFHDAVGESTMFDATMTKKAHYVGIQTGATIPLEPGADHTRGLLWAIGVIQGTAIHLHDTKVQSAVLMAAGIILRYGLAACFGEHRHFNDRGPGVTTCALNPVGPIGNDLDYPVDYVQGSFNYNRLSIHRESLLVNLLVPIQMYRVLALIEAARSDFALPGWVGGYGGEKWEACAITTKDLLLAWMRVALKQQAYPSSGSITEAGVLANIKAIVRAANSLITVSHNGGKCLTKFVSQFDLTILTVAPGFYVAQDLLQYILSRTPENCTESPWNASVEITPALKDGPTIDSEEDEDDE